MRASMFNLIELGKIALVQVAPRTLKEGTATHEQYEPAHLQTMAALEIGPRGVVGVRQDGRRVLDVHHVDHPHSRFRGANSIALGCTSHYEMLRRRFGAHMTSSCGGENIMIDTRQIVTLDDLKRYLVLYDQEQGQYWALGQARVAEPCAPFARFVAGTSAAGPTLRGALQALRGGMRGFYLQPSPGQTPLQVRSGDMVYATDTLPITVARQAVLWHVGAR